MSIATREVIHIKLGLIEERLEDKRRHLEAHQLHKINMTPGELLRLQHAIEQDEYLLGELGGPTARVTYDAGTREAGLEDMS